MSGKQIIEYSAKEDAEDIFNLSTQIFERDKMMVEVYERLKHLCTKDDEGDAYKLCGVLVDRLKAQLSASEAARKELVEALEKIHGFGALAIVALIYLVVKNCPWLR